MPDIKKGGRLIEDQEFRFLADGASQKNALLLSITRVPEQDVRKVFALHHGKGIPDFFLSSPDRIPNRPVYGYRPAAATSKHVISSGSGRPVMTTAVFFANSWSEYSPIPCRPDKHSRPGRKLTDDAL